MIAYTDDLTLYVVVTRQCQMACPYCIERTKVDTPDSLTVEQYIRKISKLLDTLPIKNVMWVGGEPLLHPALPEMVRALVREDVKHILTTNGQLLNEQTGKIPFNAINVSLVPDVEVLRSTGNWGWDTSGISKADACMGDLPDLTINIPIMRNGVHQHKEGYKGTIAITQGVYDEDSLQSLLNRILRQVFMGSIRMPRLRLKELVGHGPQHLHGQENVRKFVRDYYAPVWYPEIKQVLDKHGGTVFYKEIAGFPVSFNAPPKIALPGARDVYGRQYQIILFNDGYTSYSWDRTDTQSAYKEE